MIDFLPYVEEFKKAITSTWLTPRGIMFSEGFALVSLMKHFDIDLMIESGVAYGGSTEMMALATQKPIVGIDTFTCYDDSYVYAKNRLAKYKNVLLIKGDSFDKLPGILNTFTGNKIGIFIDGPKGEMAIDMSRQLYEGDHRIKFICIHDLCHGTPEAEKCARIFDDIIFTDEPAGYFAEAREQIDSHMLKINKQLCEESKSSLNPAQGLGYLQTSLREYPYGFGMAIIVRT
tara:strand:+ start:3082 stop:3777 length:696 start_codon:yes stop_codon:yes gene_type:complete